MLGIDGWINKTAKVPTIMELLLDKGIVTVRDNVLKKKKKTTTGRLWQKLPVGRKSAFSDRWWGKIWGEGTSDVNPMKRASIMELLGQKRRQRLQQSARILCRESHGKEAKVRKWGVRVGQGLDLMGSADCGYQLGFYSAFGEKMWGRGEQR